VQIIPCVDGGTNVSPIAIVLPLEGGWKDMAEGQLAGMASHGLTFPFISFVTYHHHCPFSIEHG